MLRPDSVPRRALLLAIREDTLCASVATLQELQEVLRRPKFDRLLPANDREAFFSLVSRYSRLWEIPASSEEVAVGACRDAKDAIFLSLALACRADALISSDADLLVLHPWQGIPVVTPGAFLEQTST